jgi:hypothetical protein
MKLFNSYSERKLISLRKKLPLPIDLNLGLEGDLNHPAYRFINQILVVLRVRAGIPRSLPKDKKIIFNICKLDEIIQWVPNSDGVKLVEEIEVAGCDDDKEKLIKLCGELKDHLKNLASQIQSDNAVSKGDTPFNNLLRSYVKLKPNISLSDAIEKLERASGGPVIESYDDKKFIAFGKHDGEDKVHLEEISRDAVRSRLSRIKKEP